MKRCFLYIITVLLLFLITMTHHLLLPLNLQLLLHLTLTCCLLLLLIHQTGFILTRVPVLQYQFYTIGTTSTSRVKPVLLYPGYSSTSTSLRARNAKLFLHRGLRGRARTIQNFSAGRPIVPYYTCFAYFIKLT